MEVGVPIGTPVVRNVDGSMAQDSAYRLMDGYLDQEENINSRPGLADLISINMAKVPDAIDGTYWWDDGKVLIYVQGGYVIALSDPVLSTYTILNAVGTLLRAGVRPTFATDGTYVYIANGDQILKTNGVNGGAASFIATANAPAAVTHIINVDGYLLANQVGSQRVFFSNLEDFSTWDALDFFSAGGISDDNVAVHEFQKEIYVFGTQSFELWQDDGDTPFSRLDGGYRNVGCGAKYSVVNTDDGVMWLDNRKRIVRYSGGAIEHIATPYDKDIQGFKTFLDCQADRIDILGREFYLFSFPGEDRTIVYNLTDNNWSEFGYWNESLGDWERFVGNCHAFSPLWNKHIWGTRKDEGTLYEMSPDFFTDRSPNNPAPIRMQALSGHISYGTNNRKRNNIFSMRAKRGRITDSSEPTLSLRLNDDDTGFSNEISLSLGKLGDTYNIIRKHRLGVYHTRQYEFTATNACGISFGKAKEDIYVEQK